VIYIGIDPGLNGAIAYFDVEKGILSISDMPTLEVKRNSKVKKEVSPIGVAIFLGKTPRQSVSYTHLTLPTIYSV